MTPYTIESPEDGSKYRIYRPYFDHPEKEGQGDKAFPAVYERESDHEHFYAEFLSSELGTSPFACYAMTRDLGWGYVPYTEEVPKHVPYWRKGAYLRGWGPGEIPPQATR